MTPTNDRLHLSISFLGNTPTWKPPGWEYTALYVVVFCTTEISNGNCRLLNLLMSVSCIETLVRKSWMALRSSVVCRTTRPRLWLSNSMCHLTICCGIRPNIQMLYTFTSSKFKLSSTARQHPRQTECSPKPLVSQRTFRRPVNTRDPLIEH